MKFANANRNARKACIAGILAVLFTLLMLSASADTAEPLDVSSLSDEELVSLHRQVLAEMADRGIPFEPETADEAPAGAAGDPAGPVDGSTVLYYHPDGGEYYHLDENCRRFHPSFLPLPGRFLYSELGDEAYSSLQPCEVCGAPARPE